MSAPACLWGAGMLGHTWLVTYHSAEREETLSLQANDGTSCARCYDKHVAEGRVPQIWTRQYGRSKATWKRVTRAAAALDGPGL